MKLTPWNAISMFTMSVRNLLKQIYRQIYRAYVFLGHVPKFKIIWIRNTVPYRPRLYTSSILTDVNPTIGTFDHKALYSILCMYIGTRLFTIFHYQVSKWHLYFQMNNVIIYVWSEEGNISKWNPIPSFLYKQKNWFFPNTPFSNFDLMNM